MIIIKLLNTKNNTKFYIGMYIIHIYYMYIFMRKLYQEGK